MKGIKVEIITHNTGISVVVPHGTPVPENWGDPWVAQDADGVWWDNYEFTHLVPVELWS